MEILSAATHFQVMNAETFLTCCQTNLKLIPQCIPKLRFGSVTAIGLTLKYSTFLQSNNTYVSRQRGLGGHATEIKNYEAL